MADKASPASTSLAPVTRSPSPPVGSGEGTDHGFTSQAILFHEYTHHWLLTNDAWSDAAFPPWFVEGFAELHATAIIRNGDVIFGATAHLSRLYCGQYELAAGKPVAATQSRASERRGTRRAIQPRLATHRLPHLQQGSSGPIRGLCDGDQFGQIAQGCERLAGQCQRARFQDERLWEADRAPVRIDPGKGSGDRRGYGSTANRPGGSHHAGVHFVEARRR